MNKMSRYQKLPSDEVETFKTAVFQIHAPTKRKKAMKPSKAAPKAAHADDTNTTTSPKTKLKNRA